MTPNQAFESTAACGLRVLAVPSALRGLDLRQPRFIAEIVGGGKDPRIARDMIDA